jgi:hypothetical protein
MNNKILTTTTLILGFIFYVITLSATSEPGKSYPGPGDKTDNTESEVIKYTYPRICPSSKDYRVKINGQEHFAYYTSAGTFVAFESEDSVQVDVWVRKPVESANITPNRYEIQPVFDNHTMSFKMPAPAKLLVEIAGMEQLFIYANDFEHEKPSPDAENVLYFKSGQLYETGQLQPEDNQTIYIEGGAVVRGSIRATSAKNVKVSGRGVLDGGYYKGVKGRPKFVLFEDCRDVTIEDIILIEPQTWMITLYICDGVHIEEVKELGAGHGTDGVDVVGSKNIMIKNCMFRNGDDCIVMKSFKRPQYAENKLNTWEGVDNVTVTGCAVQANMGGQAFEIGHELMKGPVQNITFKDCDVMGVHGQGGVFGIHNSDLALVKNVTYENIRVDHFYNKLVDFRIIKSRWSDSDKRGRAENILLKDIYVKQSIYNYGYSISLIGGYDENHKIKNVTFENFMLDGQKVTNADQLDLFIKQVEGVKFK